MERLIIPAVHSDQVIVFKEKRLTNRLLLVQLRAVIVSYLLRRISVFLSCTAQNFSEMKDLQCKCWVNADE